MTNRIVVSLALAGIGAALITGASASGDPRPSCPTPPNLPPASEFADPVTGVPNTIDNNYLPLIPGTTLKYKGKLDGESATDSFTVTDAKKMILGVATTVIHDQVNIKGKLAEDTFDWFAQDRAGNVWYFGEDTKELENGQVVSTEGSWEAGVNKAKPGIFMPADPQVGQVFKQEDAKNVAEDCSEIAAKNVSVRTPAVSSDSALKTNEFSLLEPGVLDNKFYVPVVGLVREQTVQGGSDFLELVNVQNP